MKTKVILLGTIATIAACTTFGNTALNVHQIGKDSYTVRVLNEKSTSAAKEQALAQAGTYCQKQARNVMLVKEASGTEEGTGERYYDLTFLCLTAGDGDFTRVTKDALNPNANAVPSFMTAPVAGEMPVAVGQ